MNSKAINKQIIFTCVAISLEFCITTIDFIYLEKISYLATIGVASLMSFLYMSQGMITLFAQSMINNALYHYSEKGYDFNKVISVGFIFSFILSVIMVVIFFTFKGYLLNIFKISQQAKEFANIYLSYMIPFLLLFNIQQYFTYIVYALKLAKINTLSIGLIIIFNIVFNYLNVFILHLGIKGIAIASSISIVLVMPLYIYVIYKNSIYFSFLSIPKICYQQAMAGVKRLGLSSSLEPILHQSIQFIMVIIISQIGQEMISAKHHANNFLTMATTLALSFGIIIQIQISQMYGKKDITQINLFYKKYVKLALASSFITALLSLVFIYSTLDFYSQNTTVKTYIVYCMLIGLLIEPMRALSVISKAYVKGMQDANLPLVCSFLNKLLITYPLYYLSVKYTNFGIFGILLIEACSYFINYLLYTMLIYRINKKNITNSINQI